MPKKIIICCSFALSFGVAILSMSCSRLVKSDEPGRKMIGATSENSIVTVAVAKVSREDLSQGLKLAAEFRPYQEIDLHAKVAGYVREIKVDVGDRVRQGQLIATLEIPEFKNDLVQATATKKRSESDVERANSELQRTRTIYDAANLTYSRLAAVSKAKPNLIAQQEIDDAFSKVQIAEAQVATAKAALTVAQDQVQVHETGIDRVKTIAAYSTIAAPFAGVVTKRFADKGAMIQAGTASQTQAMPVVRISQIDKLRLILPVPESVVPAIKIGRRVQVTVPSLNRNFEGRVSRFSEKVDAATRTMETEVEVLNPHNILKPGMYASADLELESRSSALTVPIQAITRQDNQASVLVVNAQKQLERRPVVIGLEMPANLEIISGLAEGDLVVIGNQSQLKPGQIVEAKMLEDKNAKGEH